MLKEAYNIKKLVIRTYQHLLLEEIHTEKKNAKVKACLENLTRNIFRSSRPGVFCEKGVLRNFVNFTGKHLCQSLFFNKVAGLGLQLY